MLCYVMLCYVMLCYVMLCYVMLCYVMLCYVMLNYIYYIIAVGLFVTFIFKKNFKLMCIYVQCIYMCNVLSY